MWGGTVYLDGNGLHRRATPYWTKNSYFGAVDTAGLPKAIFYFYKSVWNKTAPPFIKLFPHWDWNEGQRIDVLAYSNVEVAELFLNGKSLGKQRIDHEKGTVLHFAWKVVYEKGELEIKAYKDGKVVACDIKKSFGDAVEVKCEYQNLKEGTDFIRIYALDKDKIPVENARNRF